MSDEVAKANVVDSLAIFNEVIAPTAAKGVIIRRPPMVALAERMDWDSRAVRRLQKIRARYGTGPIMLSSMGKPRAVILSPQHVRRVLEETPEPFSTATSEKVAALAHFEPKNALISHGPLQVKRQRFNDQVLESGKDVHSMADVFLGYVQEEAEYLMARAKREGELAWEPFFQAWFRVIRRSVLGESAADDQEVIEMIEKLREAGNWAFLHPGLPRLRERFHDRIRMYLERGEEGSMAGRIKQMPAVEGVAPHHQIPQYLFASDPAAMATFRTLALLAAHPQAMRLAQAEVDAHTGEARGEMPFLRACVLESLRLWPTTPLVLRETTRETQWDGKTLPKGTGILIFAPFFHRDDEHLDFAHKFTPELWLKERSEKDWPLIPFSGGPAICPGRNFVLMMTTAMIASIIEKHDVRLLPPDRLRADAPMPGTLNNYDLRFQFLRRMETPSLEEKAAVSTDGEEAPTPVRGVGLIRAHAGNQRS
jgi:hypothetical protein